MPAGYQHCFPMPIYAYADILCQPSIHGYVIGATNALFKAKGGGAGSGKGGGLWDVLVDIEEDRLVEIQSPELRRALSLTTEDLRFIDYVIRVVVFEEGRDEFLEGKSSGKRNTGT
jgi:Transport protein Avl9